MTKHTRNTNTHTEKEIYSQPSVWKTVFNKLVAEDKQIKTFLSPILEKEDLQIILTGAGSSAFIGETVHGLIQDLTKRCCVPVATTDIITHPQHKFLKKKPTLLISFARSGNSPESVETVNIADKYCEQVYHLAITCNSEGKLAKMANVGRSNFHAVILPDETHDKSLAMTSSFTSMILAAITIVNPKPFKHAAPEIEELISFANYIIENDQKLNEITKVDYKRVVFLGSGPLLGIARECHLKLHELTDGQVICKHDSFLGFRHGPKAVANEETLMIYLLSSNPHVQKYEIDLIEDISKDPREIDSICFGCSPQEEYRNRLLYIENDFESENDYYCVAATLVGQLLGYFWALRLGLDPDNPSVTGAISRVVQGVNIYQE